MVFFLTSEKWQQFLSLKSEVWSLIWGRTEFPVSQALFSVEMHVRNALLSWILVTYCNFVAVLDWALVPGSVKSTGTSYKEKVKRSI